MIKFGVSEQKERELRERMARLSISEADLEEKFIASGGPGGQKRNKAATCVVLKHKNSGVEIRCQHSRSQILNRFYARRLLCERLELNKLGASAPRNEVQEKIRKQKARRRRRSSGPPSGVD